MYYKSVNRGLSFTKPGIYSIGFVLAIGLLAIISGVNGLYLFLSLALSTLIVSGLLSETVMKAAKISRIDPVTANAGEAFNLNFHLSNSSKRFILYGITVYFFTSRPKISLVGGVKNHAMFARSKQIFPGESVTCAAISHGLPRGAYKSLYVSQNTVYPFGVLEKYKYSQMNLGITVLPQIDRIFFQQLTLELKSRLAHAGADKQFFCHRPYATRDSNRTVDWKKSANKIPGQWVSKEYRSHVKVNRVMVSFDVGLAERLANAVDYEAFLSRVRTAVEVMRVLNVPAGLNLGTSGSTWIKGEIDTTLASMPDFADRMNRQSLALNSESSVEGDWILTVGLDSYAWSTPRQQRLREAG